MVSCRSARSGESIIASNTFFAAEHLSTLDEMIENRFLAGDKASSKEADGLWPQELWVQEEAG